MTTFQRARSDEQRAIRSQAILDTAAAMLAEMPVAEVTLNELSRRVGLAKSNVLHYFESREAVLLELMNAAGREWLTDLSRELNEGVSRRAGVRTRSDQVAAIIANSLAQRMVLCDLISAQAAVLERNISAEAVACYKHAGSSVLGELARLVSEYLPELAGDDATTFAIYAAISAGAIWSHANPPDAVLAAFEADPELAFMRIEFQPMFCGLLKVLLTGLLERAGALRSQPSRAAR
jgi:AcrR family transcriptional regulator